MANLRPLWQSEAAEDVSTARHLLAPQPGGGRPQTDALEDDSGEERERVSCRQGEYLGQGQCDGRKFACEARVGRWGGKEGEDDVTDSGGGGDRSCDASRMS
jgi:hypothetical protein